MGSAYMPHRSGGGCNKELVTGLHYPNVGDFMFDGFVIPNNSTNSAVLYNSPPSDNIVALLEFDAPNFYPKVVFTELNQKVVTHGTLLDEYSTPYTITLWLQKDGDDICVYGHYVCDRDDTVPYATLYLWNGCISFY